MQREDYLLRQIALMGRVLARIRRLLIDGRSADAGEEIQRAAHEGGIDLPLLIRLDSASLEMLLVTGGEIDRPKCALFAEVLFLEWQRRLSIGPAETARRCAERALLLYGLAYHDVVIDDDTKQHVATLQNYVETATPEVPD
jgi:hypothetical protein